VRKWVSAHEQPPSHASSNWPRRSQGKNPKHEEKEKRRIWNIQSLSTKHERALQPFSAMSPLCIESLPDFFFVDCCFLFFLWVVSTCVLICLVLLMDGFLSLIFIYRVFHFQEYYHKMPNLLHISNSQTKTCSMNSANLHQHPFTTYWSFPLQDTVLNYSPTPIYKHENVHRIIVRDYLNVTTWANHYDWPIQISQGLFSGKSGGQCEGVGPVYWPNSVSHYSITILHPKYTTCTGKFRSVGGA